MQDSLQEKRADGIYTRDEAKISRAMWFTQPPVGPYLLEAFFHTFHNFLFEDDSCYFVGESNRWTRKGKT